MLHTIISLVSFISSAVDLDCPGYKDTVPWEMRTIVQ